MNSCGYVSGYRFIWCCPASSWCKGSNGHKVKKNRRVSQEGKVSQTSCVCVEQVWSCTNMGDGKCLAHAWDEQFP